ncbi:MAG: GNAT family N-acetyltransferase [Chitinophagaceae bacterium]|nr:GNAT family N-acetyltransferase [Chitinophagaceae bacterium]
MTAYTDVLKHFKELTPSELYSIMRLRNEVFVVEQNCVYQDADNKDIFCHHLMLYSGKEFIGYARLLPPGLSYNEMSIGRVVTRPDNRGTGAGKALMKRAIGCCHQLFGKHDIRIGAQVYAKSFYSSLGFVETGNTYEEDGIPHIEMILH